jgi:3-oxoacyl-[acyl-carrier protein] reductase
MKAHTFKDQVAVVTGAGEGIGLEIARRLALQGAAVLLNDIKAELAAQVAQDICTEGGTCVGVGGDIGEVQVVRDLVNRAVTEFGRITIAVANAGLSLWDDFSVAGNQAIATSSVYAMTKKGLEMLARSLVSEVSAHGITVNVIAPGATVTPRTETAVPDYEPIWSQATPTGRPAYPSDIANAALFFLAPTADQITGQTLIVDGGWSATSPEPKSKYVDKTK